jgi:hypothetical protein
MIRSIVVLMVVVLISLGNALAQGPSTPDQPQKGTFVHTVFFWLDNPESTEDHAKLLEGLTELSKIPDILSGYVGVPAPTNREVIDSSYDFSLTFIFKDAADQDAYQDHPDHIRFVENYSHLWSKVVVYDAVPATPGTE